MPGSGLLPNRCRYHLQMVNGPGLVRQVVGFLGNHGSRPGKVEPGPGFSSFYNKSIS